MPIFLKSAKELMTMREAGRIVARTLAAVAEAARPGVRLVELDELAAEMIAEAGAGSSFLGYHPRWSPTPYPAVLCLSVNEQVVHGIPGGRRLVSGDQSPDEVTQAVLALLETRDEVKE